MLPRSTPSRTLRLLFASLVCAVALLRGAMAETLSAVDARGHTLTLMAPAQRIVSLAPHATELIAAVGGEARLVGVTQVCDWPISVRALPRIASYAGANVEAIVALKPDLIVAWPDGNRAQDIAQLRALGFTVFESAPKQLSDIPRDMAALATLLGTHRDAQPAISVLSARIAALGGSATTQRARAPLRVFYQLGAGKLFTLNDAHPVMAVIRRCGGQNVFGALPQSGPEVSIEALMRARPQIVVVAAPRERETILSEWKTRRALIDDRAIQFVDADGEKLHRATPRMIDAAEALCAAIQRAHAIQR